MNQPIAFTFGVSYLFLVLFAILIMCSHFISTTINTYKVKKGSYWIYGTCNGNRARKHKKEGNVQFIIWNEGDQSYVDGIGHTSNKWVNFDSSWWCGFKQGNENEYKRRRN